VWSKLYPEGSRIDIEISGIRWLSPDVAVAHATSNNEYTTEGKPRAMAGSFTLVLVRSSEGWLIDSFHNGARQAEFAGHMATPAET